LNSTLPAGGDPVIEVFIARQPIFDGGGRVIAYELLYRRNSAENWADGVAATTMASDVIVHTFLNIGVEKLTGGTRAFLNFTREMLLTRVFSLFDPRQVVIELLESVVPDEEVVAACEALVQDGYTLALDDFVYDPAYDRLLDLAEIVKLDVLNKTPAEISAMASRVAPFNVRLVAERVETGEVRDTCCALGFEFFQGYFFARPEILTRHDIPADQLRILKLMNLLRDPKTTDHTLETEFRGDLSLSFKLLRTVNSAALGGRGISSIRHAVRLTGREELHKWLALVLVSSVASRGGVDTELVMVAIQRARMCELIAGATGHGHTTGSLFMVGLFSLLDAIMRSPMTDLLERIDLSSDVRSALLGRDGPLAPPLELVEAYQRGDWDNVGQQASTLGVDAADTVDLYMQSVGWTRVMMQGLTED